MFMNPDRPLPEAARDERGAVRGQDDGRVQHRHRPRPGRPARLHRRLRSAPAAPPPHLRPRRRRRRHQRPRRRGDARRGGEAHGASTTSGRFPRGPRRRTRPTCCTRRGSGSSSSELGERFDRVVIDSPPLVAVTDSAIISTLVDGTVFVVRAFKTSKSPERPGPARATRRRRPHRRRRAQRGEPEPPRVRYYYHYYYYKREGYAAKPGQDAEPGDASASPPN